MAKVDMKFIDEFQDDITSYIRLAGKNIKIIIHYVEIKKTQSIYLDKSTAIKFSKTLRTEINKIEE